MIRGFAHVLNEILIYSLFDFRENWSDLLSSLLEY